MRVWKYSCEITDSLTLLMPKGAQILAVGDQDPMDRQIELWAEVDTGASLEERYIAIVGTGHPLPDVREYLGTVVVSLGNPLVWHVYEVSA